MREEEFIGAGNQAFSREVEAYCSLILESNILLSEYLELVSGVRLYKTTTDVLAHSSLL